MPVYRYRLSRPHDSGLRKRRLQAGVSGHHCRQLAVGVRGARELDQIVERRGYPCMIVSDNDTELTSNAILGWQQDRQGRMALHAPGKTMQGGVMERDECLTSGSSPAPCTLAPRAGLEEWRIDYNLN